MPELYRWKTPTNYGIELMRILTGYILCFVIYLSIAPAQARESSQAAFSPSGDAIALIERTIGKAEHSVDVAAYSFTSQKVANALIEAHEHGVEVRVLLDKRQGKRHYRAIKELQDAGIPIRINSHYAIMHDKYLIVDDKTVALIIPPAPKNGMPKTWW